jgi:azurin
VAIDGQPIPALLKALEHPIDGIRQRARVELSERPTVEVIAAARDWIKGFDPANADHAHHLLEALWLHQRHNVVNRSLLDVVLNSPVPHARIAAKRVARMWQHSAARPVAAAPTASDASPVTVPDDGAIVIRALADAMRYDQETFTVTAGTRVRLRFVNDDFAPHNLVVGTPGSLDAIGAAADGLGSSGFARQFIPQSNRIVVATNLLNHQKHQLLEFQAPTVPGDYAVLCTFPGHRQTMRAVMRVVK